MVFLNNLSGLNSVEFEIWRQLCPFYSWLMLIHQERQDDNNMLTLGIVYKISSYFLHPCYQRIFVPSIQYDLHEKGSLVCVQSSRQSATGYKHKEIVVRILMNNTVFSRRGKAQPGICTNRSLSEFWWTIKCEIKPTSLSAFSLDSVEVEI